jgi:hypothetical protein
MGNDMCRREGKIIRIYIGVRGDPTKESILNIYCRECRVEKGEKVYYVYPDVLESSMEISHM